MKILMTHSGAAINTSHIANLFRVSLQNPEPSVPKDCPLGVLTGDLTSGYALVAELSTSRFVLVEVLGSEELAEHTFWLLIAEMQYDNEPRMIQLDDLRRRAVVQSSGSTVVEFVDLSSIDFT